MAVIPLHSFRLRQPACIPTITTAVADTSLSAGVGAIEDGIHVTSEGKPSSPPPHEELIIGPTEFRGLERELHAKGLSLPMGKFRSFIS